MIRKDDVFGTLEYEYIWHTEKNIEFLNKNRIISLMIDGDEDEEFEDEQYEAYIKLQEKWSSLQKEILEDVLKYYLELRCDLGYDVEMDENYPMINNIDELSNYIELEGIVVPYSGTYDGREIGITFECTWNKENGIGVSLVDEEVREIGYRDIVM